MCWQGRGRGGRSAGWGGPIDGQAPQRWLWRRRLSHRPGTTSLSSDTSGVEVTNWEGSCGSYKGGAEIFCQGKTDGPGV